MPRCSACEVRKEAMAQQASVIEALTRALDAVRPAVALSYGAETKGQVWTATLPPHSGIMPQENGVNGELPTDVRKAMVTVAGFDGPLRDHLEDWATTALSFGMTEAEVARRIFEGDTE